MKRYIYLHEKILVYLIGFTYVCISTFAIMFGILKDDYVAVYGANLIIVISTAIRELLLNTRIHREDVTVIYQSKHRLSTTTKLLIIVIINLLYWFPNIYLFIIRLILTSPIEDPRISKSILIIFAFILVFFKFNRISRTTYEGYGYFIFHGNKYNLYDITSFYDDGGYILKVKMAQKEYSLSCYNRKEFDFMTNYLLSKKITMNEPKYVDVNKRIAESNTNTAI